MLPEKMQDLRRVMLQYAALVESMIEKSIQGLLAREGQTLLDVIRNDEPKANSFEIELDELAVHLIVQYQPRAGDLRTILMALGMSKDLERMADHAVNIAEAGLYLIERPEVKPLIDIPKMADEVKQMVRDSLLSFLNKDPALAKNVCERDGTVDALGGQVWQELLEHMRADTSTIERGLYLLNISRNLERIADLSTNIGEDVIYMVEGRVIKHHRDER
jgi:phosphate transport system protein